MSSPMYTPEECCWLLYYYVEGCDYYHSILYGGRIFSSELEKISYVFCLLDEPYNHPKKWLAVYMPKEEVVRLVLRDCLSFDGNTHFEIVTHPKFSWAYFGATIQYNASGGNRISFEPLKGQ